MWRESERALDFVRKAKFRDVADIIVSQQRFIAIMQGRTATFSAFSEAQFDEAAFEAQLTADRSATMICWYWIIKLKARFLSGDYAEALTAADEAKPLLWASPSSIQLLDYFYYTALTVAALYENASADQQAGWRDLLTVHREQLREWAENYPPTFADKHALVSAEIARIEGRDARRDAICTTRPFNPLASTALSRTRALAHELAARFYAARGVETIAHAYLRNARYCYLRWGADGKLRQLDQLYPHLARDGPSASNRHNRHAGPSSWMSTTVVKASQALSSEIILDRADRDADDDRARTCRGRARPARSSPGRRAAVRGGGHHRPRRRSRSLLDRKPYIRLIVPESVLQHVIRTRESVILDDALGRRTRSRRTIIPSEARRSVLCLPLLKQTKLMGALYLENNLTSHAFTSARYRCPGVARVASGDLAGERPPL